MGGKDFGYRSRVLRVGHRLYLGGFGRVFLLEHTERHCILPNLSYRVDWLFLFPIHSHILILKIYSYGTSK
jgi:hypothetical protein